MTIHLSATRIVQLRGNKTSAHQQIFSSCSEFHLLWHVVLGERETGTNVLLHHVICNVLHKSLVHLFLQLLSVGRNCLRWSLLLKELMGSGFLHTFFLEGFISDCVGLDTLEVDLLASGNGVDLIDALDWNTVDLEWSGDCKESRLQLFKEYNSLSLESASEQDENCARSNTLSKLWSLWLVPLKWFFLVISWIPIVLLHHLHEKQ